MLAFYFGNSWILFALPGLLLGLYAQYKLMGAYNHYIQVPNEAGLSGAEAAREVLDSAGLTEVAVEEVGGQLTDHYDPTKRELFLSSDNFHGRSIAAIGVAAHEAGHALQHKAAYAPLHMRMALVPITNIASQAAMWIAFLGWIIHLAGLLWLAVIAFAVITIFQLITLPVEFDASRRAKEQLWRLGLVKSDERKGVSKVLNAAALTYVAGLVSAVFNLLYYVMLARDSERD